MPFSIDFSDRFNRENYQNYAQHITRNIGSLKCELTMWPIGVAVPQYGSASSYTGPKCLPVHSHTAHCSESRLGCLHFLIPYDSFS